MRISDWSSDVCSSDLRNILPETRDDVYDLAGNITAGPGSTAGEIDPALSALAEVPVTIAAVPASAAGGAPSLGDFAAAAHQANASDLGRYRTLRPETTPSQANAVHASAPGNLTRTRDPSGTIVTGHDN